MPRSPLKYPGGKTYLTSKIVRRFKPHRTYVEPFGGGASVLLGKVPCRIEVYNDLRLDVCNFFKVLRDNGDEFLRLAQLTPYDENTFEDAADTDGMTSVQLAHAFFVRSRMSFGGTGKSFSMTAKRERGGMTEAVSAWLGSVDRLPEVVQRLREVQILNRPAIDVIKRFDAPDTLHYCDPPYVAETRTAKDVYGEYEMSDEQHEELASVLRSCKGTVILSGYPSPLYERLYEGWFRDDFDVPNNAAGGKSKRRMVECLWSNRDMR